MTIANLAVIVGVPAIAVSGYVAYRDGSVIDTALAIAAAITLYLIIT